jgi:5-methylcytosine-specific restriction endonuclease McrA
MIDNVRCEVYNASYEPLSIVSAKRALVLVFKGKASVMREHETYTVTSGSVTLAVPVQIVLKEMVKTRSTTNIPAQLTQRNLFIRDKWTCAYCKRHRSELKHGEFLTRDHIHPQSKGGRDVWGNVVAACNRCNNKKSNSFLDDTDMQLPFKPHTPTVFEIWSKSSTHRFGNN